MTRITEHRPHLYRLITQANFNFLVWCSVFCPPKKKGTKAHLDFTPSNSLHLFLLALHPLKGNWDVRTSIFLFLFFVLLALLYFTRRSTILWVEPLCCLILYWKTIYNDRCQQRLSPLSGNPSPKH